VVDGAGKPVGLLGRGDLIRALKQLGPDARVAESMSPTVPTVGHHRCLDEAFRILQEKSAPAVAVVDASGPVVGLVTSETAGCRGCASSLPNGLFLHCVADVDEVVGNHTDPGAKIGRTDRNRGSIATKVV
jgi:CBS domain-containing protein